MRRRFTVPISSAATCAVMLAGLSVAQAAESLYDPTQLPAFHGTVQLFTLTPRGDIDGFVLVDGTEIKTPPHLTVELAAAVKPGDHVTIHGLKAASLPLVQAMSVRNDASGADIIDNGPNPGRAAPPTPHQDGTTPVSLQGRLRMVLHGPRGDANGALLEDGTVVKLPPPEAVRFVDVLVAGKVVAVQGLRFTTPVGSFIDLTALGFAGGPLTAIPGPPRSGVLPVAQPPG